jgi:hypothetical protein
LIPEDLILNNTLSIQYSASAPAPSPFNLTDAFVVFNETEIVPIEVQAIMPFDVNYTFVVTFDVSFPDGCGGLALINLPTDV